MLRSWKQYQWGNARVSFSAKPGSVYSKDDFYVVDGPNQKLVVMETTNGIMNNEPYTLVTPKSLLTWQRIPVANTLATNGKQWVDYANIEQSGTYANQWIVVDMKRFTPGVGASKGFLWIVEQMPGLAKSEDVTSVVIGQGNYWPSYNIPYNNEIYVAAGFLAAYEMYGDKYSYTQCVRAQMFKRDNSSVQSFDAIQKEMRYNDYTVDPLSAGDPANAISCRKDLEPTNAKTFGGIDSKTTSYTYVMNGGVATAQNGPTHDDLAPFSWSNGWEYQIHWGQPDTFNFGWINVNWLYQ
jgi:hypothetical protein